MNTGTGSLKYYSTVAERLDSDAMQLFLEMVDDHRSDDSNDQRFLGLRTGAGYLLRFPVSGQRPVNSGHLADLVGYRLLRRTRGSGRLRSDFYEITSESLAFWRWYMDQAGSPVAEVETTVLRFLDAEQFASQHGGAAHHLRQAFDLLGESASSIQIVSEIGDHLRKAVMDVVADVTGGTRPESPGQALRDWLDGHDQIQERQAEAAALLADYVQQIVKLDHRLNHMRDELSKGEPPADNEEIRRAAFLTALACYEISRLPRG